MSEDETKCSRCDFKGTAEQHNDHKFRCEGITEEERAELYEALTKQWRTENREIILGVMSQIDALLQWAKNKKKNNSEIPIGGQLCLDQGPSDRPSSDGYQMLHAGVPHELIPWRDEGTCDATAPTSTQSGSPKKKRVIGGLGCTCE